MISSIGRTRPHYSQIVDISTRDTALMVASVLVMCALCWAVGHPIVAVISGTAIFINETVFRLMFRGWRPFAGLREDTQLAIALVLQGMNAVLYALPAFMLAGDPSIAMKVTALMFLMGMQIYIANTWSAIPVFVHVLQVPSLLVLIASFAALALGPPEPSPPLHWTIAAGVLVMFIYSTRNTLRRSIVPQRALAASQMALSAQIAAMEETQRRDPLTGVLNRAAFDTALRGLLDARSDGEVGVFLVDLDSFKPINDTYSHAAGDAVLRETADRLLAHLGDAGVVGRLGGDEFICARGGLADNDAAVAFGTDLGAALAHPVTWQARKLKISASVGVSVTGGGPFAAKATVSGLCTAADQAMFAAKSSPNRGVVLYDSRRFAPRLTADDRRMLVDGIADGSVKPFFQPKVHLPTGRIIGFEALARWDYPNAPTRGPDDFLSQINELGLQGDFMAMMAQQVFDGVDAMLAAGFDPGQVSLNVPEVALATHTGRADLERILAAHPAAARHMTFEITEDVFIARGAEAIQASIAAFRDLGVRISLDDFGTGFASFHHLATLDFDEMKIDTTFVAGLGVDPTSGVLVRGFLDIAAGLGVSVVAEGVETEDQRSALVDMGCVVAQGYLFSGAVPLEDAIAMLGARETA